MSYFITGTDTGVGKTLVSCALLHALAAQDKSVVGFKPVAAGCDDEDHNEDAQQLRAASNVLVGYGQLNPYCFAHPVAPHIAARNAGVRIELSRILTSYRELAGQADEVVVEGAGGFLVPLNEKKDSADLAVELGLPVIVVVGMRLGCLNHALLTLRVIADYGLECAGWVANVLDADGMTGRCEAFGAGVPSDHLLPQTAGYAITSDLASEVDSPSRMASSSTSNVPARGRPMGSPLLRSDPFALSKAYMPALQQNIDALRERIAAPLLGVIPYQAQPDAKIAAGYLDLGLLGAPTSTSA